VAFVELCLGSDRNSDSDSRGLWPGPWVHCVRYGCTVENRIRDQFRSYEMGLSHQDLLNRIIFYLFDISLKIFIR